jgi:hypothetical protein
MSDIDTCFEEGEIRSNSPNINKINISHSEIKENNKLNQYESISNKTSFFQAKENKEKIINLINNKYNLSSDTTVLNHEDCIGLETKMKSYSSGNYFDVNSFSTVIVYFNINLFSFI